MMRQLFHFIAYICPLLLWSQADPPYPAVPAAAQNIIAAEYFVDADPGFGMGTNISLTAGVDVALSNVSINTTGLVPGQHMLCLRTQNADQKWSQTSVTLFDYSVSYPAVPAPVQDIIAAEYFLDTDPGFGLGTAITVTAGVDFTKSNVSINTTGLVNGVHILYLRTQDANRKWSQTSASLFDYGVTYPAVPTTLQDIIAAEYFIDTDPGFGLATAISVTAGVDVALSNVSVNTTGLVNGAHVLYLRTQNADGKWSQTSTSVFDYGITYPAVPAAVQDIVAAEYFVDTDPGIGLGTAISLTAGVDVALSNVAISPAGLLQGQHMLYLRTKNNEGHWSLTSYREFEVLAGCIPDVTSFAMTACATYTWNGNTFTQSGTYVDTLQNSANCDSIVTLFLTINPLLTWYLDADADDWYVGTQSACSSPGSGYTATIPAGGSGDCNDADNSIHAPIQYFVDADGDGFGSTTTAMVCSATATAGYATNNTDCDDANNLVWQSATLYVDADGDGFDNGTATVCYGATIPTGYAATTSGFDCDDNNPLAAVGQNWYLDADADGWYANTQYACGSPGIGWTNILPANGSGDCDDQNANIHAPVQYYVDADGDGFGSTTTAMVCSLTPTAGYATNNTDCDDANNLVWQSASLYVDVDGDGFDNGTATVCYGAIIPTGYSNTTYGFDCDDANNLVWQAATLYVDADSDGYDNGTATVCYGATIPTGYSATTSGSDCDDANNMVWQSATLYVDVDGDGFDNGTATVCYGATIPTGYALTTSGSDCDDNNQLAAVGQNWYLDADADGWYANTQYACGSPGIGWTNILPANGSGDCDDQNANIHAAVMYYVDADGDGFGSTTTAMLCSATATAGYATNNTDCDDANNLVWQSATLYVDTDGDGFDNGTATVCYGATIPTGYALTTSGSDCDDANNQVWQSASLYVDVDGDGFDNGTATVCYGATIPTGYALTTSGFDCDDANNMVWQSATLYVDTDGDGYDNGTATVCYGATIPTGYALTTSGSDCEDANNLVWQSATLYVDADGDGYDNGTATVCYGETIPTGYALTTYGSDCDDNNIAVHSVTRWYKDADGDGWYITMMSCNSPGTGWSNAATQTQLGDCNDNNNTIYPGATEICGNGIDEDCSGADLPCGGGSCPPAVVTIAPNGLHALWANQGTNDPYTFYYGLADAKRLNARIQGGTGPFGYTWTSNNPTYLLPRTYYPANSIDLFRPTGPATISVTVTDSSNLCQYTATINILWDDQYFCGVVNQTWYLNMCQNGQNVCVPWSVAKTLLQANTANLGNCNTKNSSAAGLLEMQMLLTPNPNNGQFNVAIYFAQEEALFQIFSVEGRLLFEENVATQKGAFAKSFDYSAMPAGMYLVRVTDGLTLKTEKMMIRH